MRESLPRRLSPVLLTCFALLFSGCRPEAEAPAPMEGVAVPAGSDIQRIVDDHPPRSRFILQHGVHLRQQITPRRGDVFVGEPGAILDGDGVTEFAFMGGTAIDSVTIQALEIRGYAPPPQWGAVLGVNTLHWIVMKNDIHHNTGGVRLGKHMQVRGNHIHHNHQTGIMGQGDHSLIEGNEIAYNNSDLGFDPEVSPETYEAGGMKITHTRDIMIRDNFVHHNGVTGIWLDIDNIDVTIEGNRVEDNYNQGIYYEISYRGVIRNNILRRNGARGGWYHRGGIVVSASSDVEVTGNRLFDNAMGITGTQTERGSGVHGPHWLQNLDVHDNLLHQAVGVTGVARDQHVGDEVFERNNRFRDNTYVLGSKRHYFRWRRMDLTETEWIALGHDVGGRFTRGAGNEG